MRASLSQIILAQEADFNLGKLTVSPSKRQVAAAQCASERLQPRIMQVLVALARRRGEVVSRDEMMAVCWGGFAVSDDAINRCIARIRRLSETHGGFTLETIARVGYQLDEEGAPEAETAVDAPMLPEAAITALLAPEPVLDVQNPIPAPVPVAQAPSWVAQHGTVAVAAFSAGVLVTATLFVSVHYLL